MNDSRATAPTVRRRHDDDLAAAATALVRVHETDRYPVEDVADPVAWLNPTGLVSAWVGELHGTLVGHACLVGARETDIAAQLWANHDGTPINHILVLSRLFVVWEARGHKIGEHLARTVMDAATHARRPLVLDVLTKDVAAIRLYERLGWRRIGTTDHAFGDGQYTPAICYVAPGSPNN